jgi:signal transduction histidine kinase
VNQLIRISDIIQEHLANEDNYLIDDEKGKLIPSYLSALAKNFASEHQHIADEIRHVEKHLHHIKEVVVLQKDISGIVGIKENIILNEIADLAIQMGLPDGERKEIDVIKNYTYYGSIFSEKAKLLQILVNLIRNARDSVLAFQGISKKIAVCIKECLEKKCIEIIVEDNGSGISQENLKSIFSFGFTTKPDGHGFGLHSSAIAAKELGGSLKVESAGVGKGAFFIVELPLPKVQDEVAVKQAVQEQ